MCLTCLQMIWKGSLQTATRHKLIKVWRLFSENLWMISSSYLKPLSSSAAWNKKYRIFKSCRCADLTGAATRPPFLIELPPMPGLRTQPSFFAPEPSGVSRDGTRPGAKKDGCFRRLTNASMRILRKSKPAVFSGVVGKQQDVTWRRALADVTTSLTLKRDRLKWRSSPNYIMPVSHLGIRQKADWHCRLYYQTDKMSIQIKPVPREKWKGVSVYVLVCKATINCRFRLFLVCKSSIRKGVQAGLNSGV